MTKKQTKQFTDGQAKHELKTFQTLNNISKKNRNDEIKGSTNQNNKNDRYLPFIFTTKLKSSFISLFLKLQRGKVEHVSHNNFKC